jgi:hypothetical protein
VEKPILLCLKKSREKHEQDMDIVNESSAIYWGKGTSEGIAEVNVRGFECQITAISAP